MFDQNKYGLNIPKHFFGALDHDCTSQSNEETEWPHKIHMPFEVRKNSTKCLLFFA